MGNEGTVEVEGMEIGERQVILAQNLEISEMAVWRLIQGLEPIRKCTL